MSKSLRTLAATGEITSDKKLPGTTGDHLFRADREDVQRGGVA